MHCSSRKLLPSGGHSCEGTGRQAGSRTNAADKGTFCPDRARNGRSLRGGLSAPSLSLRLPGGSEDIRTAAASPQTPTRTGRPGALGGTLPAPRHLGLLPAWALLTLTPLLPRILWQTPVCGSPAVAVAPGPQRSGRGGLGFTEEVPSGRGDRPGGGGGGHSWAHRGWNSHLGLLPELTKTQEGSRPGCHTEVMATWPPSASNPLHVWVRRRTHTRQLHLSAPRPGPPERCPEAKPESAPPAQPGHPSASTRSRAKSEAEDS